MQFYIFHLIVTEYQPDDDFTRSKHVATIKIASGLLCQQHEQIRTVHFQLLKRNSLSELDQ